MQLTFIEYLLYARHQAKLSTPIITYNSHNSKKQSFYQPISEMRKLWLLEVKWYAHGQNQKKAKPVFKPRSGWFQILFTASKL